MTVFSRTVTAESITGTDGQALEEAKQDVRAHLSAVVDPDDDEERHADRVRVWVDDWHDEDAGDLLGVKVNGEIDADPDAPYLREDFDPEDEAEANPLSVPSQHGEHSLDEGGEPQ